MASQGGALHIERDGEALQINACTLTICENATGDGAAGCKLHYKR
jgi:hypothetical protein